MTGSAGVTAALHTGILHILRWSLVFQSCFHGTGEGKQCVVKLVVVKLQVQKCQCFVGYPDDSEYVYSKEPIEWMPWQRRRYGETLESWTGQIHWHRR